MKLMCLCAWSQAVLMASVGGLGPLLGPLLAVWGRSWGLCWRSWAALEAYVGGLGPFWDLCWRSWTAPMAYVGGPGALSGPTLAVLGGSRPKCGPRPTGTPRHAPNPSGSRIPGGARCMKTPSPPVPVRSTYFFCRYRLCRCLTGCM